MKVFLCSYNNFSLAIPMDLVSSIMLYKKHSDKICYIAENNNTYISLPLFFNFPSLNIYHGIILKDNKNDNSDDLNNKIILLSTEIESETEIPNNNIFPIQKSLKVQTLFALTTEISQKAVFSDIFNGLFFIKNNLVLLLNPLSLIQIIKKEFLS